MGSHAITSGCKRPFVVFLWKLLACGYHWPKSQHKKQPVPELRVLLSISHGRLTIWSWTIAPYRCVSQEVAPQWICTRYFSTETCDPQDHQEVGKDRGWLWMIYLCGVCHLVLHEAAFVWCEFQQGAMGGEKFLSLAISAMVHQLWQVRRNDKNKPEEHGCWIHWYTFPLYMLWFPKSKSGNFWIMQANICKLP